MNIFRNQIIGIKKFKEYKINLKMGKKISIIMSYINRKDQLEITLFSINKQIELFNHNIEVVIVDDGSDDDQKLNELIKKYSFPIKLIVVDKNSKKSINPCIGYNLGFLHSIGELIIIQNPEVCHLGNVIDHVEKNVSDENYLIYPVKPMANFNQNNIIKNLIYQNNDNLLIENIIENCHDGMMDNYLEWYQHPKYRNAKLHFLSALTKKTLNKIGGFDPEFYNGVDWDDNDIRNRIERVVKSLSIDPAKEKIMAIHLFHSSSIPKDIDYRKMHLFNKSKLEKNDKEEIVFCDINKYLPNYQIFTNLNS